MRKLLIIASIALSLVVGPAALAQPAPGATGLQLTQPTLQVQVPGLTLTKAAIVGGRLSAPYIAQYVSGVYRFLLSIVGVVAAISMIYGGFLWMTSGGTADRAKSGKKRIIDSIIGLVLAFGSYLILYIINPATVNFSDFGIISVSPIVFSPEDLNDEGDIAETPPTVPSGPIDTNLPVGPICRTVETCRTYCSQARGSWPKAVQGALNPANAVNIPNSRGLSNPNNKQGSQALVNALTTAGTIAVAKDPDYQLVVSSGYRPLADQITMVCDKINAADAAKTADEKKKILDTIGSAVAWPGGSNHGYGNAVDLRLTKNGSDLTISGQYQAQRDVKYRAPSLILDEIMTKAGFRRYSKEIWHFEVGTTSACRCTYPSCPWPPSC